MITCVNPSLENAEKWCCAGGFPYATPFSVLFLPFPVFRGRGDKGGMGEQLHGYAMMTVFTSHHFKIIHHTSFVPRRFFENEPTRFFHRSFIGGLCN
jgi:hypothetical protein